ncbi:MAG: tyrosine-type recombinase/integrase [Planctomycetota bacterium]
MSGPNAGLRNITIPSTQAQSVADKVLALPLGRNVKDFLDYLTVEGGLSNNTVLGYGRDLKGFLTYCKSNGIRQLQEIQPSVIQQYMVLLSRSNKAESSIKRCLVAIRMLLRFARLTGLVEEDFTAMLEGPKLWQKLPTICSKNQVISIINAPLPGEPFYFRDKAILELLYATGVRASELAGLKTSNLNLDIGYLRCLGKGNRERIIPMGKAAMAASVEYLKELRPKLARAFSGDFLLLSRTGRAMSRFLEQVGL